MVNFQTFVNKYPQFQSLSPDRFALFLPDVSLEIQRNQWGQLKDLATEMLLGHYLSISSNDKGAIALNSFEVDDKGYKVSYQQSDGEFSTSFGKEYARLLASLSDGQVSAIAPQRSTFHGVRLDQSGIYW